MEKENAKGEIAIYRSGSEVPKIEVKLEEDTVWLTQAQMAELFSRDRNTISEHIKNVYDEQELKKGATTRKFRVVQNESGRAAERSIEHYNLDVIISVGYRVKSRQGTQFRIWANKILKDFLVKGYAVNEQQLLEHRTAFKELQGVIKFIKKSADFKLLKGQQLELLSIIDQYASSFSLLYQYDEGKLIASNAKSALFALDCQSCRNAITALKSDLSGKGEAGELFGNENGAKFEGVIGNIYQSFEGEELYQSLEEKAAHLLYFVIKDHPFYDGNKRIASMLFLYFLQQNNYLWRDDGSSKIDQNTLVALALLIAISEPKDKEVMVRIVMNLIR